VAEISKTELKIMQRIWRHEEGMTVAQITEELNDLIHLNIDQKTVATMIYRLQVKGCVDSRGRKGRYCIYVPVVSEKELRIRMLKEVLADWFFGSMPEMVSTFHGIEKDSEEMSEHGIEKDSEEMSDHV